MKKIPASVLMCVCVLNLGLALAAGPEGPATQSTATIAGEFVSRLPVGTNIKLKLNDGATIEGTLMAIQDDVMVVKPRTRLPEPPLKIALNTIVDADIERGSSLGRTVAAATAAGAGAALGVFFLLVAIYAN